MSTTKVEKIFFVESKDKAKSACTVDWADDEFTITCSGTVLYVVKWKTIEAVNVQAKMFGPTLAVIDCIPDEQKSPLLVKLWLPSLIDVQVLSSAVERHKKRARCGSSVLWGAMSSSMMLPFYHRSLNQGWRSLHFMLEITLIAVTAFIFLDLLGMHDPGVGDEFFQDDVAQLLQKNLPFEELQVAMSEAVGNLTHEDQAIVARRWKEFDWRYTLISDKITKHKKRAVRVLSDNDYLAKPTKKALRFAHRWYKYLMRVDYADLLMTHPYILLCIPFVMFALVLGGTMVLWALCIAVVIYCLKHVTVMVLSFKLVVIAKHIVLDAKSFYSAVKNMLRIGTDSIKFCRTVSRSILRRIHI
eukprot:TRINITY_DN6008_c0_g1_i4.p3 TRINITY_DN6008_c0_g1~~TRINITY_DN6008_c0_g1_i4.p3  ORF type:complete len:358 (+),score=62.19 TRINITY_DN6008_c0_g1_i4:2640-3713(+)